LISLFWLQVMGTEGVVYTGQVQALNPKMRDWTLLVVGYVYC